MDQALALTRDLKLSGLSPDYMDIRPLDVPERASTQIPRDVEGYVIPYFTIDGARTGFYRVRTFDYNPKYKQPKNTSNYVYFPPKFKELVNGHPYILVTEGEKKAASAAVRGIPAVALSGVDSWRNRTTVLPEGTELKPGKREGEIIVKTPEGARIDEGAYAKGFEELVKFAVERKLNFVICYDTEDNPDHLPYDVQRAAAVLGYELRFMGVPVSRIRQLVLPPILTPRKTGLDDFLTNAVEGTRHLERLIQETLQKRTAFPLHPNVREFVNKKLDHARLDRKETQSVALAILSDLDAAGCRYRSIAGDRMYYFDETNRGLMRATVGSSGREQLLEAEFSRLLYQRYGLSAADNRVLQWLGAQFSAEEPVQAVSPHRIVFADHDKNTIRYQINDGQYACITSSPDAPATIHDNGHGGFLFESGLDNPIEAKDLVLEITRQQQQVADSSTRTIPCWWEEVLADTRLKNRADPNVIKFAALLYYISPWLWRWKGTQLPIEIITGEAGSGKSTLCSMRLAVLLGSPLLRNCPSDLKDWHASVTNSGGLHVIDNVKFTDRNLQQRMSDEICRLITEPSPHIEMRKYYTHSDLVRIPVEAAFAVTAIQQPFPNADLIARAVIIELDKDPYHTHSGYKTNADNTALLTMTEADTSIEYASDWVDMHLNAPNKNGRAGWIAHHILVLNRFFQLVEESWDPQYRAKHRLINLEQAMIFMARVFGWPTDWIQDFLSGQTVRQISDADWTIEGLTEFANFMRQMHKQDVSRMAFSTSEIVAWAQASEDFQDSYQLTNARKLGRYMSQHRQLVSSIAGMQEAGLKSNKMLYKVMPGLASKK